MAKQRFVMVATWFVLVAAISASSQRAAAQTVWCGPSLTFEQPAAGQADALNAQVSINRGFTQGIYNLKDPLISTERVWPRNYRENMIEIAAT